MSTKELMTGPLDDTPPPKTIPTGKWLFEIADCGRSIKSSGKMAWFSLRPVAPVDTGDEDTTPDVEEVDAYSENGLENETVPLIFPEERAYDCLKFMTAIGVTTSKLDWRQLGEIAGMTFYATITHDPNTKDPLRPWVRFRAFERYQSED